MTRTQLAVSQFPLTQRSSEALGTLALVCASKVDALGTIFAGVISTVVEILFASIAFKSILADANTPFELKNTGENV